MQGFWCDYDKAWYYSHMNLLSRKYELFLRNLVFGVEDGIVSTVGLLSGIAIANVPRATIFLTGVILIFVEAISMAAGSFLAEESVSDHTERESDVEHSLFGGVIMFFSYFVAGFIPLFPYIVMDVGPAFYWSIILSFIALFALGYWSGRKRKPVQKALRMMLVGGAAIIIGVTAGSILS